jgi:hypothetical protein
MRKQSEKPGFWRVVLSTLAAAFGVQSRKNLQRDAEHGNLYIYVASGVIFTVFFVLTVIFIVQFVLNNHGL